MIDDSLGIWGNADRLFRTATGQNASRLVAEADATRWDLAAGGRIETSTTFVIDGMRPHSRKWHAVQPRAPTACEKRLSCSRSIVCFGNIPAYSSSKRIGILIFCIAMVLGRAVAAELPPCAAPILPTDIQQITRVIRAATPKRILMIANVLEDSYVAGAVTGDAYEIDTITGKRSPQYIRTDLVSVYMRYTDRSHVEVYSVRKVRGRWKIEEKKDWFL